MAAPAAPRGLSGDGEVHSPPLGQQGVGKSVCFPQTLMRVSACPCCRTVRAVASCPGGMGKQAGLSLGEQPGLAEGALERIRSAGQAYISVCHSCPFHLSANILNICVPGRHRINKANSFFFFFFLTFYFKGKETERSEILHPLIIPHTPAISRAGPVQALEQNLAYSRPQCLKEGTNECCGKQGFSLQPHLVLLERAWLPSCGVGVWVPWPRGCQDALKMSFL